MKFPWLATLWRRLRTLSGRILARLLAVNLVVVLVPIVGLEFARIYERQLLGSLERDMRNQAALVRSHFALSFAMADSADDTVFAIFSDLRQESMLASSARTTRTRIRILDRKRTVVLDSHRNGPPEGAEPSPPSVLIEYGGDTQRVDGGERWPDVADRREVASALSGERATMTRVRSRAPGVFLFLAEPIRHGSQVVGVVYVTRSTHPVLVELYRIRSALLRVLALALLLTTAVTVLLALSISRPLGRLSRAARRVAQGEHTVLIPLAGQGEIRELAQSFAQMKDRIVERLTYISRFSADVAHEFKSPLTSIRGAAELLQDGAVDDAAAREKFLRNIRLDVDRLDRLVTRLLLLSRLEASEDPRIPVDVAAIAERVAVRSTTLDKRVQVDVQGPPPTVYGRGSDLEIALSNLVENALRYTPAGESVQIVVRTVAEGVELTVMDRGPGVSEELRSRVFDRFFTTDGERGGTGLGLAIVRAIARAHGGEVQYRPIHGQSSFTMWLPAEDGRDSR